MSDCPCAYCAAVRAAERNAKRAEVAECERDDYAAKLRVSEAGYQDAYELAGKMAAESDALRAAVREAMGALESVIEADPELSDTAAEVLRQTRAELAAVVKEGA